jgi:hypothetical protein
MNWAPHPLSRVPHPFTVFVKGADFDVFVSLRPIILSSSRNARLNPDLCTFAPLWFIMVS